MPNTWGYKKQVLVLRKKITVQIAQIKLNLNFYLLSKIYSVNWKYSGNLFNKNVHLSAANRTYFGNHRLVSGYRENQIDNQYESKMGNQSKIGKTDPRKLDNVIIGSVYKIYIFIIFTRSALFHIPLKGSALKGIKNNREITIDM